MYILVLHSVPSICTHQTSPPPQHVIMAERTPDVVVDLDHLLQAVRDGLLLHPAHAGVFRIVIESEVGDPLHVVKVDTRRPHASRLAQRPRPRSASFGEVIAVSSSAQQRYGPERGSLLLERCGEQQRRITELEQRLQEIQQELYQRGGSSPPAHPVPLSPASLTDNDSSSSISSNSPHRSDDDDDGHEISTSTFAMTDDADDAPSSSLPRPQASDNSTSTAARKSGRSKNTIDRWTPSRAILSTTASSTHKERKAKRRRLSFLPCPPDLSGFDRQLQAGWPGQSSTHGFSVPKNLATARPSTRLLPTVFQLNRFSGLNRLNRFEPV